jgi:hypothetical protein
VYKQYDQIKMSFLLVQIGFNVILLRLLSEKDIRIYKAISYLFYPLYILFPIIEGIVGMLIQVLRGPYSTIGFAVDITNIYSKWSLIMLVLATSLQLVFNKYLIKYIRNEKETSQ